MSDDTGFKTRGNRNRRFHEGCAVQVIDGALDGMTGVLVGYRPTNNCLIRLDGIQRGVLVVIHAASLRESPLAALVAHAARPAPIAALRLRHFNFDVTGS